MKILDALIAENTQKQLPTLDVDVSYLTAFEDENARKQALKAIAERVQGKKGRKPQVDISKAQGPQQEWFRNHADLVDIVDLNPETTDEILREITQRIMEVGDGMFETNGGLFVKYAQLAYADRRPVSGRTGESEPGDHIKNEFQVYAEGEQHSKGLGFARNHYGKNFGLYKPTMEMQGDTLGLKQRSEFDRWLREKVSRTTLGYIVRECATPLNPELEPEDQRLKLAEGLFADAVRSVWHVKTDSTYMLRVIGKELLECDLPIDESQEAILEEDPKVVVKKAEDALEAIAKQYDLDSYDGDGSTTSRALSASGLRLKADILKRLMEKGFVKEAKGFAERILKKTPVTLLSSAF